MVKESDLVIDESIPASRVLDLFVSHLVKDHGIDISTVKKLLTDHGENLSVNREIVIPVCIFSERLGSLEMIVKYLVEVCNLKKRNIAQLLNRTTRTIWASYQNAKKKYPEKFVIDEKNKYFIPVSRFNDRSLSTLEIVVVFLRENYSLTLAEVASLIKRKLGTVCVVYNRAKRLHDRESKI